MNNHGLDNVYVEKNRSNYTHNTHSSNNTPPTTASQVTVLHAPLPQTALHDRQTSPSASSTVVPYMPSRSSTPELTGQGPHASEEHLDTYYAAQPPVTSRSLVPFDQRHSAVTAHPGVNLMTIDYRDEAVREVGASITPGVDNTPYLQYALSALTEEHGQGRGVSAIHSSSSEETNPTYRFLPAAIPGLFQPPAAHIPAQSPTTTSPEEELAALRRQRRANPDPPKQQHVTPILARRSSYLRPLSGGVVRVPYLDEESTDSFEQQNGERDPLFAPGPGGPGLVNESNSQPVQPPREVNNWQAQSDKFTDPEKAAIYPSLTYRPWAIGTQSLTLLAVLCTLMTAALIFCAIYSDQHDGLTAYGGSLYDGTYFLFRVLPQLLAAVILLYAQNVVIVMFRVLPFSALASDDTRSRRNVGFLPLYPKSFLWPQLISAWQVWIPIFVTWILNFSIPLQSCLFTVVYVDQVWRWSTVQGVAWVLVALYLAMLLSALLLIIYWRNRRTGLGPNWDIRTLADIIALVSPSNSSQQYAGTETAASRNDMRHMLRNNLERLGYWRSPEVPEVGLWYGIGVSTNQQKANIESFGSPIPEKGPRGSPPGISRTEKGLRTRYLPWCMRNIQIIVWITATAALLITLFAVCFNSRTDLRAGFLPLLNAAPVSGAFSAADFLYAFLPSLLGMVIFLMFQSMDLSLRILTPWGELSRKDGALATESILLDYAACLPVEAAWRAFKHRHWRVACISVLSTILILVPVLAGGLFMALTPQDGNVRMFPNIAVLAVLLTLLILMLFGLISLFPQRDQYRLPHAVTCLAEIISFCSADELRADPAFEFAQSHRLLAQRLGAYLDDDEQSRWYFGWGPSRKDRLSIRRFGRYTGDTPKVLAAKQRVKAIQDHANRVFQKGQQQRAAGYEYGISRPVTKGNTTMISP